MYTIATSLTRSVAYWICIVAVLLVSAAQAGNILDPWTAGINKDYSNNKQLAVGDPMTIEWSLDSGEHLYELKLVQETWPGGTLSGVSGTIEDGIQGTRFTWIVSAVEFNLSFTNIFHIRVTNGNDSATTHYFNITTNSPSAPTATVWQTAGPGGARDKPLSDGAATGIFVGIVVGVVFMFAGLGWWVARAHRER
ncbi:hypothetical protein PG991_008392 [Apiospora marii]|uniref:Uncharacterized protein n=1 Tax=Apiospora marii TaxID=335849 RepID=A0ABR1RKJ5_9PEZI